MATSNFLHQETESQGTAVDSQIATNDDLIAMDETTHTTKDQAIKEETKEV